jgi:hypothetical protein
MKECPKCKSKKPTTKEYWYIITDTCKEGKTHPKRVGRPKGSCLECRRKASDSYNKLERVRKERALNRQDKFKKLKNNVRVKQKTAELKQQFIDYLGGSCKHCGYDKCPAALDFHHLDPSQKEFSIRSVKTRSFELVKEELDKCILLCSNCHREEHFNQNQLLLEEQIKEITNANDF